MRTLWETLKPLTGKEAGVFSPLISSHNGWKSLSGCNSPSVSCLPVRGQAPTWGQWTSLVREMQGHSCGWKLSMVPTVFATGKGIWRKFYQILLRSQCSWLKLSAVEVRYMTEGVLTSPPVDVSISQHVTISAHPVRVSTYQHAKTVTFESVNVSICQPVNVSISECVNILTPQCPKVSTF